MAEISKITIKDIEDYLIDTNISLGLPSYKDILRIHCTESYFRVMSGIIRRAKAQAEAKIPYYKRSNIYARGYSSYEFIDNFQSYLDGKLDFYAMTLVPIQVVNVTGSLLYQARSYSYEKPFLHFFSAPVDSSIQVYYLAHRPIYLTKNPTEDEFTEDSCIYGYEMYDDYASVYFLKELEWMICKYIMDMRKAIGYTELPVDIYAQLEERQSTLDNELNEFYLSPTMYSNLWK